MSTLVRVESHRRPGTRRRGWQRLAGESLPADSTALDDHASQQATGVIRDGSLAGAIFQAVAKATETGVHFPAARE
jgi:hypothetical protein